ncbi:hypothetical protein Tco_0703703 [Tanacetum coccineum]|uniref:Uncharacterized protein n=1 Tax=Tanacetum coccineum TaxID=301880 RepID=A0ABQ4Y0E5_9ASTR
MSAFASNFPRSSWSLRFQWVSDDELEALEEVPQSPGHAPPSPDYVPAPEHPLSPDYVLGPKEPEQASLSPNYIPEPNYIPIEDQPLPVDASPKALSPGYEEEEESSGDDANDEDEEEASKDDDEEEEEHLASADSFVVPAVDPVPSAEDTEAFEADEAAGIRLRAASPPTHHPSEIPSLPLLLSSTTHRDDLTEADMPLQKRARFTAPTGRFKVGESSSAAAARAAGHTLAHRVDYRFVDTMDASICVAESRAMTTIEEVNERVTDLVTTKRQETHEL